MCQLCCPFSLVHPGHREGASHAALHRASRRAFVLGTGAMLGLPAFAQVDVGPPSRTRALVPAETLERAGEQQYSELISRARADGSLAGDTDPQLRQLRAIARRLIPFTTPWNPRAAQWPWEVNLIRSRQVNAFCMPGGKIAFYTGILDQLKLNPDEIAMVMGHEMAHALREHAREQLAKTTGTSLALQLGARLLGLGDLGDVGARAGARLFSLKFSRDDESEADLVGLELAARAGFDPRAGVSLWQKMAAVSQREGALNFLSTHPSGPDRIRTLEANVPKVDALYRSARPS